LTYVRKGISSFFKRCDNTLDVIQKQLLNMRDLLMVMTFWA
jgi:hypothetical protein